MITFDDGYEDNLTHASPLLARFAVPATVFVATGQVGAEREFWWDELERILLASPRIPPELAVEVAGGVRRFAFGGDASWTEAELDRHRDWTLSSPTDPTERHRAFRVLSDRLRASPPDEIERVVAGLAEWAGTDRTPRPSHATLDEEGLRDLADRDGIEIGAHTISHPKLPVLEPEARWREIEGSRAWLEDRLGRRVESFAYPFGRASGSVKLVDRAGYAAACTTRPGLVTRRARALRLPRLHVGDWPEAELEARLRAALA